MVVTWDDHEVDNDYANDQSEHLDPQFLIRVRPPIRRITSTCPCGTAPGARTVPAAL